jgi:geranylgeranyl diphosphate synthase type II
VIPKAISAIAAGAGTEGMVGGQVLDVQMEGGKWKKLSAERRAQILQAIHENKTAALLTASVLAGAILAGATDKKLKSLKEYGRSVGLAFQAADDILDVTADKKLLGKKGSDEANQKLTYVSLYGLERSKRMALDLSRRAKNSLKIFGKRGWVLNDLADYIVERTY